MSFAQTFVTTAILTAPDGLFVEQRTGRIEFPEISTKILEKVACFCNSCIFSLVLICSITGYRVFLLQNPEQQHQQPP